MRIRPRPLLAAFVLVALAGIAPPSRALRPGDLVTSFGNEGYVRIPFDRAGESAFDAARFVRIRSERPPGLPVSFPYLYVAGATGDRAAIVKLTGNGTLVSEFGANGRVFTTQGGIARVAGLAFAPNGDVVIGYSVVNHNNFIEHPQAEDFFIEVFDRDGAPRVQQQVVTIGLGVRDVNWVGVNLIGSRANEFTWCDPDTWRNHGQATALAQASNGALALVGRLDDEFIGDLDGSEGHPHLGVARFEWDGGANVYRRSPTTNILPGAPGQNWNSAFGCAAGDITGGGFKYFAGAPGFVRVNQNADAAAFLADNDLRVGGTIVAYPTAFVPQPIPSGGYHAVPADPNLTVLDASGQAFTPTSGYWGADSRGLEFPSMQWVPSVANLFLYGNAEDETYANGRKQKPVITFYEGSATLAPRWAFLSSDLSALYSVAVRKGMYDNGKHVLLGPTRLCAEINDCSGEWDGYFVHRTAGPPDSLAFPPDAGFGEGGSRAYRVPGFNGVPAERAWASDAARLESSLVQPGTVPSSDLIVAGDFRRAGASDAADFDWFVSRIRLRGEPGALTVALEGTGSGRVSASPAVIDCPGTCVANDLEADREVLLVATPAAGSSFSGWRGDSQCLSINGNQCRVHIDGAQAVTAQFGGGSGGVGRIFRDGFE
jgi:hypothetical protein